MVRAEILQGRSAWWCAVPLALWAAVHAGSAMADIDYDTRRSAALRRCDEPQHHGRVDEARTCYRALLRDNSALVRAGSNLGARRYQRRR